MKVFIMTDLEGVSCADNEKLWDESTDAYTHACERLMADLNAAIRGAFDAGADGVTVYDGHGPGGFVPDLLDERALWSKDYSPAVFADCEAFVIIGQHAKAGTAMAFLDHTQSSANWFDYTINGVSYGEMAQDGAYAGAYGIPVVALSGDEAACREAESIFPGIQCACVKTATGRFHADCIPAAEAEERIYTAVRTGVENRQSMKPFRVTFPADIRVTYLSTDRAEGVLERNPSLTRLDGRTLGKTISEIRTFFDLLP